MGQLFLGKNSFKKKILENSIKNSGIFYGNNNNLFTKSINNPLLNTQCSNPKCNRVFQFSRKYSNKDIKRNEINLDSVETEIKVNKPNIPKENKNHVQIHIDNDVTNIGKNKKKFKNLKHIDNSINKIELKQKDYSFSQSSKKINANAQKINAKNINANINANAKKINANANANECKKKTKLQTQTLFPLNMRRKRIFPERESTPPRRLQHNLDRVLFSPGVHYLQDPRTAVFNFSPYLKKNVNVRDFDFNWIPQHVGAAKDKILLDIAKKNKIKYVGSSSSVVPVLAPMHLFLSNSRPLNISNLSMNFVNEVDSLNRFYSLPARFYLRKRDSCYAIEASKEFDSDHVLSVFGNALESLLTEPPEQYESYIKSSSLWKEASQEVKSRKQNEVGSYHYTSMNGFLFRSQIDCHNPYLPGTGTFDIKTRAAYSVRNNLMMTQIKQKDDYFIKYLRGIYGSFEREYYDLCRNGFLKYGLQARIGNMDGVFIAYHNLSRLFGFQYVPLSEMDSIVYGGSKNAQSEFNLSIDILHSVFNYITDLYPNHSFRIHAAKSKETKEFCFWIEVMSDKTAETFQSDRVTDTIDFDPTLPAEEYTVKKVLADATALLKVLTKKRNELRKAPSSYKTLLLSVSVDYGKNITFDKSEYPNLGKQEHAISYTINRLSDNLAISSLNVQEEKLFASIIGEVKRKIEGLSASQNGNKSYSEGLIKRLNEKSKHFTNDVDRLEKRFPVAKVWFPEVAYTTSEQGSELETFPPSYEMPYKDYPLPSKLSFDAASAIKSGNFESK